MGAALTLIGLALVLFVLIPLGNKGWKLGADNTPARRATRAAQLARKREFNANARVQKKNDWEAKHGRPPSRTRARRYTT
jgi:hypothetical protein